MKNLSLPAIALSALVLFTGCSSGDSGPKTSFPDHTAKVTEFIGSDTKMSFTVPKGYTLAGSPDGTALILTGEGQDMNAAADWLIAYGEGRAAQPEKQDFIAVAALPCAYTAAPENTSTMTVMNGWRYASNTVDGSMKVIGVQYSQSQSGDDCLAAVVTGVRTPEDNGMESAVTEILGSSSVIFPLTGA